MAAYLKRKIKQTNYGQFEKISNRLQIDLQTSQQTNNQTNNCRAQAKRGNMLPESFAADACFFYFTTRETLFPAANYYVSASRQTET